MLHEADYELIGPPILALDDQWLVLVAQYVRCGDER